MNAIKGLLLMLLLTASSGVIVAQKKATTASKATPCLDVLNLFTAAGVPALAPEEEAISPITTPGEAPENLPGKGLAQHTMLYIGENNNKMAVINNGKVIWTYQTGKGPEYDDVWMLSNGNILFSRMQYVALISPDKKVLWRYDCKPATGLATTEIHTCQPIGLDKVMFVINGLPPKLMIVNTKTGKVEVEHELPNKMPPSANDIHAQFRRARVTAQGTYLVSFLNLNLVIEYDKDFNEKWIYNIPSPWAAIRLKNGNTLINDEKDWLAREVNSKSETVWEFNFKTDLPAEYQFLSAPQTSTRLANGNTIFTSRGQRGKGPQLIEVSPDKKIVWVLNDWKNVGDASAVQILDDPGVPEVPGESGH
ncbi:hypothetical protein ACFQZS_12265 [Mucilaginibacter calamicampi]|uniref:Arylsulfotransferase (ASST) n=1 Tax=Mucilaginibacter calamicampi TaxID=1302352 RepID=A0ABW2Z2J8_9SPHI